MSCCDSDDDDKRPLRVWIGDFDTADVARVASAIELAYEREQDTLAIFIHSSGGSIPGLLAIADLIDAAPMPVSTVCLGAAYSAAAALLACGTKGLRFVSPSSRVMLHQAQGGAGGTTADVRATARELGQAEDAVMRILDARSGKAAGYWRKLIASKGNSDVYLSAKQAVKHGLADKVAVPIMVQKTQTVTGLQVRT